MFPGYIQPRSPDPEILSQYVDHPWARLTTTRRAIYDPLLTMMYRTRNTYQQYVTHRMNMGDRRTQEMIVSEMYDIHPNFNEVDMRALSVPTSGTDTRQRSIRFKRYAGRMSFHRVDAWLTYFSNIGGIDGYRALINGQLGFQMNRVMELLARNAMLQMPFTMQPSGTLPGHLTEKDKISTPMLDEIYTQFLYRQVPYITGGMRPGWQPGQIVCVTTPGVLYDLQKQTDPHDWLSINAYANPQQLLTNEVASFKNIRFVTSDANVLWNFGAKEAQVAVSSPIKEGDGASKALVDTVWTVGQPNATNYIQLAATDVDGNTVDATYMAEHFRVNDYLTIHSSRTSDFGVTNGPDYRDGRLVSMRIASVDTANRRVSFTDPILSPFDTELSSGVYAYVTKGLHVHVSMFIGAQDAVMMGIGEPPRIYVQRPLDVFESMYNVAWDMFVGYQPWNPFAVTPVFSSGLVSIVGKRLQG